MPPHARLTEEQRRLRVISETAFQSRVVDYARYRHWRVAHFRPARTSRGWRTPMEGDAGFPDLVLARLGRVIFAELKTELGTVDADQDLWRVAFGLTEEQYVWRPRDWERIVEILA